MYLTLFWVQYDLRHFALSLLLTLERDYARPTKSHSLTTLPLHVSKSTESISGQATWQIRQLWEKAKKDTPKNLLKREWQVGKVTNIKKKASVSASTLV